MESIEHRADLLCVTKKHEKFTGEGFSDKKERKRCITGFHSVCFYPTANTRKRNKENRDRESFSDVSSGGRCSQSSEF
jgi:hypothetical protein